MFEEPPSSRPLYTEKKKMMNTQTRLSFCLDKDEIKRREMEDEEWACHCIPLVYHS